MTYQCRDCSYQGKKSGPTGACPACGSFNIMLKNIVFKGEEKSTPERSRLFILLVLWSVFIILLVSKLF